MKKKWLLFVVLILILVFTLLPAGFLDASPGNLVINGDFSDGLNHWDSFWNLWAPKVLSETIFLQSIQLGTTGYAFIRNEELIDSSNKNLTLSLDVLIESYNGNDGRINPGFSLFKNGVPILSGFELRSNTIPVSDWTNISINLSDAWYDTYGAGLPDFDEVGISIEAYGGCEAYIDNVKLEAPEGTAAEPIWVRTMPMTCYRVWVNEDNNFQFLFWYPYSDNNWVKIYDMSGKEVFSIDMPYDNPNLIVDLPNGTYTVKTFTVGSTEPIQTFVIGK
jgi:hypothetical protein